LTATRGLLEIIVFMLLLSIMRTNVEWKTLGTSLRARLMPEPKPAE
jgi:hypothetical protein